MQTTQKVQGELSAMFKKWMVNHLYNYFVMKAKSFKNKNKKIKNKGAVI